jgi:hypothetical protein
MSLRSACRVVANPLPSAVASACALVLLSSACIPDPKGDFEEFGKNTESQRTQPVDAGPLDGSAPREPIKRAFLGICLSSLSSGRPDKTLRFYTDVDYKPTATGGTLAIDLLPMKVDATVFEKASGIAPNTKFASVPVLASGGFAAAAAIVNVDGLANGISGRPITIEGVTLNGAIKTGTFCARFAGQVTAPIQQAFTADCIFLPLDDKAAFKTGLIEFEYATPGGQQAKLTKESFVGCPAD